MTAPATQIKEAIVAHLRGMIASYTMPIPETQIRGLLDLSGTPKDAYGITVGAEDLGDHAGNTGRILVDIRPNIVVFSHLDEDPDGSLCDALAADTLAIMQSIQYCLDGWVVAWNGNWQLTDTQMDNSFRQITLNATLPIVRQPKIGG
jgi:hypothetical protein